MTFTHFWAKGYVFLNVKPLTDKFRTPWGAIMQCNHPVLLQYAMRHTQVSWRLALSPFGIFE